MPQLVFSPGVPHNPVNYQVPSAISMWWLSRCPDGTKDSPIELGSVADIEFTPNETVLDLKGARTGTMTTDQRVITDVSGTISFKIHEMVGSNLNLLFRPVTTATLTGGNGKLLYGQTRVNLNGTTATEFAPDAVDYDAAAGATLFQNVDIIRVQSTAIADPITGFGTQFNLTSDYLFTNASGSTIFEFTFQNATGAFVVGETLTLPISAEYDTGAVAGVTPVAVGEIMQTAVDAGIVPYNTLTAGLPAVGDVLVDSTITTSTSLIVGVEILTATTGNIYVSGVSTNDITDIVAGDTLTTAEGFAATAGNGVRMSLTAVAAGSTTDTIGAGTTISASGALFAQSATNFAAGAAVTGSFGVFVGATNAASISVNVVNAASSFTVTAIDTANNKVEASGSQANFLNVFVNHRLTGGTSTFLADVTATNEKGGGTAATLTRVASGAVTDGQEVVVTYSYRRDAFEYSILDGVIIEGELQLQILSINGPQSVYTFNRVNLSIDGNITINPEARTEPTLQATILPDGLGKRGTFSLLNTFTGFSLSSC